MKCIHCFQEGKYRSEYAEYLCEFHYNEMNNGRYVVESYAKIKARQEEELNKFNGMFFAFNNEQFERGMKKFGLTADDKDKVMSIGSGGFILKTVRKDFIDLFDRHNKEKEQAYKDEHTLLHALIYELRNHEYCITLNPTDALDHLGLKEEDVDVKLLNKAKRLAMN